MFGQLYYIVFEKKFLCLGGQSLKPGSQYDAGATSVTSVVSITEKSLFHQSNCIPDIKFLDNLIGWTLANARDATLE